MFKKWIRLYAGTLPANKEYVAGSVPANKEYAAGTPLTRPKDMSLILNPRLNLHVDCSLISPPLLLLTIEPTGLRGLVAWGGGILKISKN